jgi:hypothetical protein
LIPAHDADPAEADLRVGGDRFCVVGRRIDRESMVAAPVEEVRGQRPDGIGTEAAALGRRRDEEVDAGASEVGSCSSTAWM